MSEKEFSKNDNPHVPRQADETDLLPPENDDAGEAEGHEAELPPDDEVELSPPGNAGETENNPDETELSPPKDDAGEAERQEAGNRPDEAGSLPSEKDSSGKAKEQKVDFYSIDAILSRCKTDFTSGAEGYEAERCPVEAKPIHKKAEAKKTGIKARCHPIEEILRPSNNEPAESERGKVESHQTETESRGSGEKTSPENAVGDVDDCSSGRIPYFSVCERSHIQSGMEAIFRKFFGTEYNQTEAQILGRQRRSAEVQRPRYYLPPSDSWEERFVALKISELGTVAIGDSVSLEQNEADESTEKNVLTATTSNPETVGSREQTKADESTEENVLTATTSNPEVVDSREQTKADESTEENVLTTTTSNPETVGSREQTESSESVEKDETSSSNPEAEGSLDHKSQARVISEDPANSSSSPEAATSQPQCD